MKSTITLAAVAAASLALAACGNGAEEATTEEPTVEGAAEDTMGAAEEAAPADEAMTEEAAPAEGEVAAPAAEEAPAAE